MKSKFNVNDTVKIKDGSNILDFYGGWTERMGKYVGKTAIISRISEVSHGKFAAHLYGNPWVWGTRCFELVSKKKTPTFKKFTNNTIVIYRDEQRVVALDKRTGEKAVARCAPEDKFDFEVGAKLAFDRLLSKKPKFKVGDKVIGNGKASYTVTNEGWKGTVIAVEGKFIRVTGKNVPSFGTLVLAECFDIDNSIGYNGKVVCVETKMENLTAGKIYEVKEGLFIDDEGCKRPFSGRAESIKQLEQLLVSKFIEIKE